MCASDVKGQGPVELLLPLPPQRVLGFAYIVPFLINMTTSASTGDVGMALYRLGCLEMLEYCNFQRWAKGQPAVMRPRPTQNGNEGGDSNGDSNSDSDGDGDDSSSSSEEDDDDAGEVATRSRSSSRRRRRKRSRSRRKYSAEELVSLAATRPELSVVLAQSVSFAAGQSLLTLTVGAAGNTTVATTTTSTAAAAAAHGGGSREGKKEEETTGAALTAKSANHVRVSMTASTVRIRLHPVQTLQFLLDHFRDTQLLAECVALLAPSEKRQARARATRKQQQQQQQQLPGHRGAVESSSFVRGYALFAVALLRVTKKYVEGGDVEVRTGAALRVVGDGRDAVLCLEGLPGVEGGVEGAVLVASASVNLKEVMDDLCELWKAFVGGGGQGNKK